jgi:CYTH domain-containing protein
MEIERKFLLAEMPSLADAGSVRLRQGYLATGSHSEVRLREADGAYRLTVKSGSGMVREEREIVLEEAQFEALWPATEGRRIEKRRVTLPAGSLRYEIDLYDGPLEGLAVVEVEFPSLEEANAFNPPAWFGAEVTDDPAYKNATLAARLGGGGAE